jgi:hypothetical protein
MIDLLAKGICLTLIKVVNTPVKYTRKNLKNLALLSLWMAKVERQIISALSASGEAPNAKGYI